LRFDFTPGWRDRKFSEPIPLPNGKPLETLRDAALYITKLPKAEHDSQTKAAPTRRPTRLIVFEKRWMIATSQPPPFTFSLFRKS
jgi:hypothetical protein